MTNKQLKISSTSVEIKVIQIKTKYFHHINLGKEKEDPEIAMV